jgi:heme/copper-type cytochrome/quinol oxidase subunit 2
MSDFLFNFIGFILLGSVAIVLILGIYTLFKGGDNSKKYSNKLMQLRVLLQFFAVIILVLMAYFFKN